MYIQWLGVGAEWPPGIRRSMTWRVYTQHYPTCVRECVIVVTTHSSSPANREECTHAARWVARPSDILWRPQHSVTHRGVTPWRHRVYIPVGLFQLVQFNSDYCHKLGVAFYNPPRTQYYMPNLQRKPDWRTGVVHGNYSYDTVVRKSWRRGILIARDSCGTFSLKLQLAHSLFYRLPQYFSGKGCALSRKRKFVNFFETVPSL